MFESITTLVDDDLELDTSFTPVLSSTQKPGSQKRQNESPVEEVTKKCKVEAKLQTNRIFPSDDCENSSLYSPGKVVKRMFPGPAGLLTDQFKSFKQNSELVHKSCNDENFILCSQQTVSAFVEGPWKMMTVDFHISNGEQLFEKYTVNWIKKNYSHKKALNNYRAPFLAAIIQNLDTVDGKIPSVHITLKDATGVIDGTILYSFYKEMSKFLTVGSVVVLKQFGVLTSQDGYCLTITSNNLIAIYHIKDANLKEDVDPIEKIILHKCTADEIWKEANTKNTVNVLKSNSNGRLQLSNLYDKKPVPSGKNVKGVSCSEVTTGQNNFFSKVNNTISVTNFMSPKVVNNPSSSNVSNSIINGEMAMGQNSAKRNFNFKKGNRIQEMSSSVKDNITSQTEDQVCDLWKSMLEDVDTESLFGDF